MYETNPPNLWRREAQYQLKNARGAGTRSREGCRHPQKGAPGDQAECVCSAGWEKSPGRRGSADRVPACEGKGCCFDPQSGHSPGVAAPGPRCWVQERQPPIDVSPSLPPSLKTIKTFKKERKEGRKEKEGVDKYLKESWPIFF